jgi:23S rRNA (cytosine1962-C5)-methyltransferase
MKAGPLLLETTGFDDYRLLDSGAGRKLERFGEMILVRPEEQAIWSPRLAEARWQAADAIFTGATEEEGAGRWQRRPGLGDGWTCRHGALSFECRFTSFRHVGVFPEQEAHWRDLGKRVAAAGEPPAILNLFGYTGVASLVAAAAGARVTHVDASKKAIAWARDNQAMSGLEDRPIRWICDDAMKFAAREVRRGSLYQGILLDPPKYGRGPKNEVWRLFEDLPEMLRLCRDLLAPEGAFLVLTAYAIRASFLTLEELAREVLGAGDGARLESGELVLKEEGGRRLSTSLFCCWSRH